MSASTAETLSRLAKARRIAACLIQAGLDDPSLLDDEMIELAREAAGYSSASEPTRALVRELLADRGAA